MFSARAIRPPRLSQFCHRGQQEAPAPRRSLPAPPRPPPAQSLTENPLGSKFGGHFSRGGTVPSPPRSILTRAGGLASAVFARRWVSSLYTPQNRAATAPARSLAPTALPARAVAPVCLTAFA